MIRIGIGNTCRRKVFFGEELTDIHLDIATILVKGGSVTVDNVKNRKLVVDLLNQDLQGEHGAIIQYLYHAWTLDLPGISSSLESVAREEMYHFQWLSNRIVELGGDPSTARYPVYLEAPSFKELLQLNVKAEDEAVAQYEEHIAQIDDQRTISLLRRIISDEARHRTTFIELAERVAKLEQELDTAERSPEAEAKREKLQDMLNSGVKHEYSVILQYLHQAYTAKDRHFGHAMEQSAIVEMKHMGWLAEHVAEMGGKPAVERNKIILADHDIDMVKADIADEVKATELYEKQIAQIDDEELKDLLGTIKYHEEYHLEELEHYLRKMEATNKAKPSEAPDAQHSKAFFTVGSLIKDKK